MRALSFPDRLLNGLERTADSFAGRLPLLMQEAGFEDVAEAGCLKLGVGRIPFYAARNPS